MSMVKAKDATTLYYKDQGRGPVVCVSHDLRVESLHL
jgi:hypothetical protein